MGRKRHTAEQIIGKLREAEIELARGRTTVDVIRKLGIPSRRTTSMDCSRFARGSSERGLAGVSCKHLSGVIRQSGAPKWGIRPRTPL